MSNTTDFSSGVKYDTGKIRYDLVPPEIEEALAKVFTIGAIKYKPRNCETGFEYGRLYAAARRHMAEWAKGYDTDNDSGLPHLCASAWSLLMIYLCQVRGIGVDDRSPHLLEKAKESSVNGVTSSGTEVEFNIPKNSTITTNNNISIKVEDMTKVDPGSYSWPITPLNTSGFEVSESLANMLTCMGVPVVATEENSSKNEEVPVVSEIKSSDITCANFNEEDDNCIACSEYGDEPCYIKKVLDNNGDIIKEEIKSNENLMKEIESRLDKIKTDNTIYIEY